MSRLDEIQERVDRHNADPTRHHSHCRQVYDDCNVLLGMLDSTGVSEMAREFLHLQSEVERLREQLAYALKRDLRDTEGKLCSRITELEAEVDRLVDENNVLRDNVILVDIEARQKTADRANQDADTIDSMGAEIAQLRSELKGWAGQVERLREVEKWLQLDKSEENLTKRTNALRKDNKKLRAEVERLQTVANEAAYIVRNHYLSDSPVQEGRLQRALEALDQAEEVEDA